MIINDIKTGTTGRRVYFQNREENPSVNIVASSTYVSNYSVIKTEQDYLDAIEIFEAAYQKHKELKG
jgi:hypothetical protein